ncbi:MAG: S-layer homology domain-containing protein [Eubacteriales bacterium]|nr:S-layer homology domain-containing protein [Eubacteriales bacterium]
MKKFLGVLLSLIMMLSLLPMSVTASDFITRVEVSIPKPIAGEPWRWHKTATTVNKDSNYTVYQNAEWYDETEKPQETPKTTFVDVKKGQYYYDAVMWAAENGITGGTSANTPPVPTATAQEHRSLHSCIDLSMPSKCEVIICHEL